MEGDDRKKNGVQLLKSRLSNYFRNRKKAKLDDIMWTTFEDYKFALRGPGYSKGFVVMNSKATNQYRNKTVLAYMANIFMNPAHKRFYQSLGVAVDEDLYALSMMIQWIFRSKIRDIEMDPTVKIHLFVPSSRMRSLLENWLKELAGGEVDIVHDAKDRETIISREERYPSAARRVVKHAELVVPFDP